MVKFDTIQSTTTDMETTLNGFSVNSVALDRAEDQNETYWDFDEAQDNIGYYKQIPELKKAIDALAMWTAGKGWTADDYTSNVLNRMSGWGEDTSDSIFWNMVVMKKVVGDSFAEIVLDERSLPINLKPISPERVRIVVGRKGIIKAYDVKKSNGEIQRFKPQEILHLCNDRVGDEIHGTSVIDACKWIIDARNEAMETYKKIMKRALSLGILYIDSDDEAKLRRIKEQYKAAVENGEVLILPKDTTELKDGKVTVQDFITWIRYLENFFYQAVGIPKVILGGSEEFTEASSKVGYLTFEQVYMSEQRLLEQDIKAQLGLEITFERPTSIKDEMGASEAANTGQTSIQPAEAGVNMSRE